MPIQFGHTYNTCTFAIMDIGQYIIRLNATWELFSKAEALRPPNTSTREFDFPEPKSSVY